MSVYQSFQEVRAFLEGLRLTTSHGLSHIACETNPQILYNTLQDPRHALSWEIRVTIAFVLAVGSHFQQLSCRTCKEGLIFG